jgi:hypothetical protein
MTEYFTNDNMDDVIKFLSYINEKRTRMYEITSENPYIAKSMTNLYKSLKTKNKVRIKLELKKKQIKNYLNKYKDDALFYKSLKAKLTDDNKQIFLPQTGGAEGNEEGNVGKEEGKVEGKEEEKRNEEGNVEKIKVGFNKLLDIVKNKLIEQVDKNMEQQQSGGDLDNLNKIKAYNTFLTTGKKTKDNANTYDGFKGELYNLENDKKIMAFKYNQEDKYIFIAVTFVLRIITLTFVKWAIDVDFVNIFESALYLYIGLYIIFIGILWGIVNYEGIDDTILGPLKYYLYSFNKKINNGIHLIIHLTLLFILSFIPFIIQAGKNDMSFDKYNLSSVEEKRDMYRAISSFSLLMWIILSMIALV